MAQKQSGSTDRSKWTHCLLRWESVKQTAFLSPGRQGSFRFPDLSEGPQKSELRLPQQIPAHCSIFIGSSPSLAHSPTPHHAPWNHLPKHASRTLFPLKKSLPEEDSQRDAEERRPNKTPIHLPNPFPRTSAQTTTLLAAGLVP